MHAKMTRNRKRSYIVTIQKTIQELEAEVDRLRGILTKVQESQPVTPLASPRLGSLEAAVSSRCIEEAIMAEFGQEGDQNTDAACLFPQAEEDSKPPAKPSPRHDASPD
jgi:hypothetical protein